MQANPTESFGSICLGKIISFNWAANMSRCGIQARQQTACTTTIRYPETCCSGCEDIKASSLGTVRNCSLLSPCVSEECAVHQSMTKRKIGFLWGPRPAKLKGSSQAFDPNHDCHMGNPKSWAPGGGGGGGGHHQGTHCIVAGQTQQSWKRFSGWMGIAAGALPAAGYLQVSCAQSSSAQASPHPLGPAFCMCITVICTV